MMKYDYDLIFKGDVQQLSGQVLEELIGQELRTPAETCSPHLVFALVKGQWWRLFTDGPILYLLQEEQAPEAWESTEHQIFCPLRDLGRELELRGRVLSGWSHGERNHAPSMSLNFQDGVQITFFASGSDSWSSFDVTRWMFSHRQ